MLTRKLSLVLGSAILLSAAHTPATQAEQHHFALMQAVPSDVFLCVAARHNPQREFLDRYWGEVFDALLRSGIGDDIGQLIISFLGPDQRTEFARLKARALELSAGVDWRQLFAGEMVFAERLPAPVWRARGGVTMGPPEMAWLFRGETAGSAANYAGLAAIIDALVVEINQAAGREVLVVHRAGHAGADMVLVQLHEGVPDAVPMMPGVARHENTVVVALGKPMLADVLDLLAGTSAKTALGDEPRFAEIFARLPAPQDSLMYVDMQCIVRPMNELLETVVASIDQTKDIFLNGWTNPEANRLMHEALRAWQAGDTAAALAHMVKAYEQAPTDSVVLYNLACAHALTGAREAALDHLERAVEAGFHAPAKISMDEDFASLRGTPRYEVVVNRARELAARAGTRDIVLNSSRRGPAHDLQRQVWDAYREKNYERGLELAEQARALAPRDSRVLYNLACFHVLLGRTEQGLELLERAVESGFYAPTHIERDPDWEPLRTHKRYQRAVSAAHAQAVALARRERHGELEAWRALSQHFLTSVGILDRVAMVEFTEGYAVRSETITLLASDAAQRAIYPVIARPPVPGDWARFLPKEARSFSVSSGVDFAALHTFIENSVRMLGDRGASLLERWQEIQADVGFDLRADALAWMAGPIVTVTLANDLGSVWLLEVSDEKLAREKVSAAVEFLVTRLIDAAAEVPMLGMLMVTRAPVQDERLEGFENLHFVMSPRPVVWGVSDGHLLIATSADAAALCLSTARGTHPNVRENSRLIAQAIMPTGPFAHMHLTDQRQLGESLATGAGVAAAILSAAGPFIPDVEARALMGRLAGMAAKLAAVARTIDFYESTASCTTFDGQAWHTKAVTHYCPPSERAARRPR